MLKASSAYKKMMNKSVRNRAYISVSLGVVNQSAQGNAKIDNTSQTYYSKGDLFDNSNTDTYITYASLEENYVKADGSFYIVPEKDGQILDNGLTLPTNTDLVIKLGEEYSIKGITLEFGPTSYPTSLSITTAEKTLTYTDNTAYKFATNDVLGVTDYIIVSPTTMVGGTQQLHIKNILLGVGFVFSNSTVEEFSAESYVSGISEDLSYATYQISVFDTQGLFDVDNNDSFMSYLTPLQPVKISMGVDLDDGTQEWKQIASAYLESWSGNGNKLSITATDKMSQLEDEYENNVLEERTAYSEFEKILTACGFEPDEYDIDTYLEGVTIKNPVEKASYSECLQVLANATCCVVREDENGILRVQANFTNSIEPDEIVIATSGDDTTYSNPANVINSVDVVNMAFTSTNATKANGNYTFEYDATSQITTNGYISGISDENGTFATNPYFEITMPSKVNYYGITLTFGGCIPKSLIVTTYADDTEIASFTHTDITETVTFLDDYQGFNKLRLTFTGTEPSARIQLNKLKFGFQTDYELTKDLMYENPVGEREMQTKEIKIKIYTYTLNEDNEPTLTDDEVYYTKTLNVSGETKTIENPMIDNITQAETLAEWLASYYNNNVNYSVSYRGEPRIQATDIIRMDSNYKNNLQVEVEKATLEFNGAFSGELELRRAMRV
jgi:hypothetical protein